MRADSYAQSEIREENWSERSTRVTSETRDLIAQTRVIIATSLEYLAKADRYLKEYT